MGNKNKSSKMKASSEYPSQKRALYLENKTIENDDQSLVSIKKSPMGSEISEDFIKMSPESNQFNPRNLQFSINKSQTFSQNIVLNTNQENQEFSVEMLDFLIYEEYQDYLPHHKKALNKLKNSNFWFDILNKKFANDISPNEYNLKLTRLHAICELSDFQRELRLETLSFYQNLLFVANQSGDTPFLLIFKKMVSTSQIISLLPSIVQLAKTNQNLFWRNKRGENIMHCLLLNKNLSIHNKSLIIKHLRKNINKEHYEELILQENLTDEIPFIYALSGKKDEKEEDDECNLLGNLVPKDGFWAVCEKMRNFLKVDIEEVFRCFILGLKPSKNLKDYYEFVYIYDVNVAKALLINGNYEFLLRYYKEKTINLNVFCSDIFPFERYREQTHFLELLFEIDLKPINKDFFMIIENLIKEIDSSLKVLFQEIKSQKNLSLIIKFKKFLYDLFARVFSHQIITKSDYKKHKKIEIVMKPINLFKRILHSLYSTLIKSKQENEKEPTRSSIKDIHQNLLAAIFKKILYETQRKTFNETIINLINHLQKLFSERDIGILIIDSLDYCLENYKQNESLFKKLLKNYIVFLINSLDLNYFIELIDNIFCFFHQNKNKKFLHGIKATPLFILRILMDRNSLSISSSFNLDNNFVLISIYECVKLNKPAYLNILKQIDTFNPSGFIAFKLHLHEKSSSKELHIIRKLGVLFYTNTEDYKLCLKKSKKNLYDIAYKRRFYNILLILLEWEASIPGELMNDRIKIIQLFLKNHKFNYLKKEVLSKISLNFKDVWLSGSFADMKMIWEQIFNMNSEDFKQKFLKSNMKEILDSKIRDDQLFKLCKNLRIEVNDVRDDFLLMNENINGFEMLVNKKFINSLQFFLDYYLINLGKDLKSFTFMNIFNKRMKFTGMYNLFETLILNNHFKFFYDNNKRFIAEKIDLSRLTPYEKDGSYNFVISNQLQSFFLFCLIFDIGEINYMKNLYCSLMKISKRACILPAIFSFLLFNVKWEDSIDKDEVKRFMNIINNSNNFNQNEIESILMHKLNVNTQIQALQYSLNDKKVLFEKSLCSFRYQIMKMFNYFEMNFCQEIKNEGNRSVKHIFINSKALQLEKDAISLDCSWVTFSNKKVILPLNVLEKAVLLIDLNYLENAYGYFLQNLAADCLETCCYFKINVLELDEKVSKDMIVLDNLEEISEPLITIKCEIRPLEDKFKNYSILNPFISEYKLW